MVLAILISCCSNENLNYTQLKLEGYIEVDCNTFDSYSKDNKSYIEFNKYFDDRYTFLIARCFDTTSCIFNINKEDKITCQRYSYNNISGDKRDYLNKKYREFENHHVLYLKL